MQANKNKHSVAALFDIFRTSGHLEYHGELVSQVEHALQSAYLAMQQFPEDPEFIIAAFLHDFGHLCPEGNNNMNGFGIRDHEQIGADTVRRYGFSEKTARLIAGHVLAKRYLVSSDPLYFIQLSDASKKTLEKQGGLLSPEEQEQFEADDLFELHIALRRIDEKAKIEDYQPLTLENMEALIRNYFDNI